MPRFNWLKEISACLLIIIISRIIVFPGSTAFAETDETSMGVITEEELGIIKALDLELTGINQSGDHAITVNVRQTKEKSELRVTGAVLIKAPVSSFLEHYKILKLMRQIPAVKSINKIDISNQESNFRDYAVATEELNLLKNCEIYNSKIKLCPNAINQFRNLDWDNSDASEKANILYRRVLNGYVQRYLQYGLDGMCVYADQDYLLHSGKESRTILEDAGLKMLMGEIISKAFLEYPVTNLDDLEELFYWKEEIYCSQRPITTLNHSLIQHQRDGDSIAVVANLQIYANHYIEASLEQYLLIPFQNVDYESGFILIYVNTCRFDTLRRGTFFFVKNRMKSSISKEVESRLILVRELLQERLSDDYTVIPAKNKSHLVLE
ncbi:MAG: hypothetical protein GF307_12140 [candidate division Zixibacteria bacterium]|nr:hypothetical protein [candidate division Zixibacteria bacterium]